MLRQPSEGVSWLIRNWYDISFSNNGTKLIMTDGGPKALQDGPLKNPEVRHSDGPIDLRFLLTGIWRGKWIILICALIGFGLSVKKLRGFNPKFEATMTVIPTSPNGAAQTVDRVSQVAQSFGIGVSERQKRSELFDRLRLTLGSVHLTQLLEKEYGIIRKVFHGSWNPDTQSWKKPAGWRFDLEQKIKRSIHLPLWREPSTESFSQYLASSIEFLEMKDMPYFQIRFANEDSELARWVLETVVFRADKILRHNDQGESKFRRQYLETQIQKTSVDEHRKMFLSMIANEERRLLLLHADRPYSMNVINPVFVSKTPTSPDLIKDFAIIVIGWILGGIALVMLFTLVKET